MELVKVFRNRGVWIMSQSYISYVYPLTMFSQVVSFEKKYNQGIHFFVAVKELDKVLRIALGKVLDCQRRWDDRQ